MHDWFYEVLLPVADPRRRRLVYELTDTLRHAQPTLLARIGGDGW
jgi:hypothetical protein